LGSTDSGLGGSALSSRSSSEAVDSDKLSKKLSLKQTQSLGYPVDEGVADLHGSSIRHQGIRVVCACS